MRGVTCILILRSQFVHVTSHKLWNKSDGPMKVSCDKSYGPNIFHQLHNPFNQPSMVNTTYLINKSSSQVNTFTKTNNLLAILIFYKTYKCTIRLQTKSPTSKINFQLNELNKFIKHVSYVKL